MAVDSLKNVYVVDKSNNRALKYIKPLTTDVTADKVFGQGNQFNCISPQSPNTLCVPDGVAVDGSNNLYVVDANSQRILKYLAP